jgi:hypothetical protein
MATNWTSSNPCPSCGRTGYAIKCTNCNTVGCGNGNCKHGGPNSFCKVCNKATKKEKI